MTRRGRAGADAVRRPPGVVSRWGDARAYLRGSLLAAEIGMRLLGRAAGSAADVLTGLAVQVKPIDNTRGDHHAQDR